MAIELNLSRPDSGTNWGFRLVGGSDFSEPLVIVKVNKNSIAEDTGLQIGDVLVRVSNEPTSGLTHAEVHDLIRSADKQLTVAVRRGLFPDIPMTAENYNKDENANINNGKNAYKDSHKSQDIQLNSIKNSQDAISNAHEKKWSTFLQKPKNAKPAPKKQEERKIIGEPYRVKIVKQKKRDPKEKKAVHFDAKVAESKEENTIDLDEQPLEEIGNDVAYDNGFELRTAVTVEEETTIEMEDVDLDDEEIKEIIKEYTVYEDSDPEPEEAPPKLPRSILKTRPLDIHIDPVVESSLSLEEQLAAVQKQLLTLSQLPSAIQVTLEAVTEQLNKIVKSKSVTEENETEINDLGSCDEATLENEKNSECSAEEEENDSTSENAEQDITETEDENNKRLDDEIAEDIPQDALDDEDSFEVGEELPELTEEEKEAKRREEEMLAKKQKEMEYRKKIDWAERPIILPGGRKWSGPDDTTPKHKNPKLSDEKISEMIETYSEVIVGKTKGINFLKYQPPPTNLAHLQNSEVYRLIHGMESPMKGIGVRAEKVFSEKDYYEEQGAP